MTCCLEVVRNQRLCSGAIEYEARITTLENRLALAMKQLDELGCDNQWYIDQAQALIEKMQAHIPMKVCEETHLAAAIGNRPCNTCGEDSWVKEKPE